MKHIYLISFISFCFLTSCLTASYQKSVDSSTYGVDYREGKWVLNTIECPFTIKDKMVKLATNHFDEKLGKNFYDANSDKSFAISYIPINPDSLLLKRIKIETKSDYIINIKGEKITDNIGAANLGRVYSSQSNSAKTTLQIYDLNTSEIIFSQTVTGSVNIDENTSKEFRFTKQANSIIISSLKKILKKID